jgi:DNA-directed RNA polymerase subunit RPC12/RpoP
MSIRETMQQRARDAKDVISSYKYQRADLDKTIAVVEFAEKVLAGEPKSETNCGHTLRYSQRNGYYEESYCSECQQTVQGYEKDWTHCPKCGSRIVKVDREDTPEDRLTRNAVKNAVDSLTLAGGK